MMKDVNNATEFLRRFVVSEQFGGGAGSTGQMSFVNARRAFAAAAGLELTQFAVCRPELRVVKLQKAAGAASGVMLWPPCVRVRRCGGCCTSKLLECRPVAVSTVNITVLQVRISVQQLDAFESEGQKVMSLEQHDRCACGCRQLASECVAGLQEYRQAECRCACVNHEEALQCTGADRLWDSTECVCKCRHPTDCSTGFYYSFQTCRCEVFRDSVLAAFRPRTSPGLGWRRMNRYQTPATEAANSTLA